MTNTQPVYITNNELDKLNRARTISAQVRFLHAKGLRRSEIAKVVGIRVQHVRNVLITPIMNAYETIK